MAQHVSTPSGSCCRERDTPTPAPASQNVCSDSISMWGMRSLVLMSILRPAKCHSLPGPQGRRWEARPCQTGLGPSGLGSSEE